MNLLLVKSILIFTTISECSGGDSSYDLQYKLINDLQSRANPNMMPYTGQAVNVTFGVSLHQIIDVDEKHQHLSTNMWVRMKWMNPFLSWNKTQYGGIDVINLASDQIWIPDLVLYHSVSDEMEIGGYLNKITTRVIIYSSGHNVWLAPAVFKSHCRMDIASFPFDQQNCDLKYGSWTYDGGRINLLAEETEADLGGYSENGEWQVIKMRARRNSIMYICCPNPYIDVTYKLVIRRKPLFYAYNLILPCVVITLLTLLSFLLPPESGERISLAITILLAMTVFMLLVAESVPASSDSLPIIAVYYYAAMIEEALALVAVCFTLNWYYHNPKLDSMPDWIRKYVLGWLATVLRINKKRYRCYNLDEDQKYVSFHGGIKRFSIFDKLKETGQSIVLQNVSRKNDKILRNDSIPENEIPAAPLNSDHESASSNSFDSGLETGEKSQRQSFDESSLDANSNDELRPRPAAHLWKNVLPKVMRRQTSRGTFPAESTNNVSFPPQFFRDVQTIADTVRNHDRLESDMDEWRLAAAIMDTILFWVFVITIGTTTMAVFLPATFVYDD